MEFEEVDPTHFSTLRREPFPHVLIEQTLSQMGEGGVRGNNFRKEALNAAGWPFDGLTTFSKHPQQAADAFNRLRRVLAVHKRPDAVIKALIAENPPQ
jgi:hypothetical protein